jgi:hypothetical protein
VFISRGTRSNRPVGLRSAMLEFTIYRAALLRMFGIGRDWLPKTRRLISRCGLSCNLLCRRTILPADGLRTASSMTEWLAQRVRLVRGRLSVFLGRCPLLPAGASSGMLAARLENARN